VRQRKRYRHHFEGIYGGDKSPHFRQNRGKFAIREF
jgi:hypothetical protein